MSFRTPPLFLIALFLGLMGSLDAQPNRISSAIDSRQTVVLTGRVHPKATPAGDRGAVADSFPLPSITLAFKISSTQQAALDQLLAQQQDPSSPNFRQWLTPEQYADRFGLSSADLQQVRTWLQSQGFTIANTARSRTFITFAGTAGQVAAAFHTPIHQYLVDGQVHYANSADPALPAALANLVSIVRGLHDFRPKPHLRQFPPSYTGPGGVHEIAPGDFATIYDVNPLYNLSPAIDGTGQKIAIMGQSDISTTDLTRFRSTFNLPALNFKQVLAGPDPGVSSGDELESDLDLEWSGAVARNAQIIFVNSTNVLDSATYAVDNALAPVMSMSYGLCEPSDLVDLPGLQQLAQQANSEGMTWIGVAGDTGAADCEVTDTDPAQTGLAVDEPGSIPEVTSMGGTMFNEGNGNYWGATGTNGGTALSYIPEIAWNESSLTNGLASGGGGKSIFFPQPAWQTGAGVPSDGVRHVPDIAFNTGAAHDPYYIYSSGATAVGGTSAAAPTMAGVVALLNQYLKTNGLGNINPTLYRLAKSSPSVFHDTTGGNNIVPCVVGTPDCTTGSIGYSAAAGYDLATGLGSVDVSKLVTLWSASPATTTAVVASIDQNPVFQGAPDAHGNPWSFTLMLTEEAGIGATLTDFTVNGVSYTSQIPALFGGSSIPALGSISATMGLSSLAVPTTVTFVFSGVDAQGNPWTVSFPVPFSGPQTNLTVAGATNGASYQKAYAPGMILSVFGSALADFAQSASTIPLPEYLAGFEASISGVTEQLPLYYVSPGQVNIQIPYETPSGLVTLTVYDPYNSNGVNFNLRVTAAAPGIFTFADGSVNPSNTAVRGQEVVMYITGEGKVSPSLASGATPSPRTPLSQLPKPTQTVSITVGGVTVATPFAFIGIPSGLVGVTQINFTIPSTVPLGVQPVVVTVGGVASPPATINITN